MAATQRNRLPRKDSGSSNVTEIKRSPTKTTTAGKARQLEAPLGEEDAVPPAETAEEPAGDAEAPAAADEAAPPAPKRGRKPRAQSSAAAEPTQAPSRVIVLAQLAEQIVATSATLGMTPGETLYAAESILIATGEMPAATQADDE